MKKEYLLIVVVSFFILAYILDAVAKPLTIPLPTPYHFFTSDYISIYPFTTTSIVLKGLGIAMGSVIVLASISLKRFVKGAVLLIMSGLLQLYALQNVVTKADVITLEWSLGLALGGLMLLIPSVVFFCASLFERPKTSNSTPFEDTT